MQTVSNWIDIDIDIDRQQLLQNIGYGADCEPPSRSISLVDEYADNAHSFINPSYAYAIRDVELILGSCAVIEGPLIFQSEVIARLLELCQKAALFSVTIGGHLEEMVKQLTEDGLVLQATVLDAIGSSIAERAADYVQDRIERIACAQGLSISRRFSPGYCDWDVSQQRMLFRAIQDDATEVELNESYLMLPRKSISGIIGIGPAAIENYNPCKSCEQRDCIGRR
ncbi:vitamin B12 dependent-methionine synthase activation domain-containing protein [Chloroflexota bacterium]